MRNNMIVYGVGSTFITAAVICSVYRNTKQQFYPTTVYLSHSKPCLLVFANMGLVLTFAFGQAMKRFFFGKLGQHEVENLMDKIYGQIIDILLALTVFRNEFDTTFIVYFTVWMFLKIFHWISQDRVDHMQPVVGGSWTSCIKLFILMILLGLVDALFLYKLGNTVLAKGPSMLILFCFEFLILLSTAASTIIKFFFYLWDRRQDGQWHGMGVALMYLEFVTDIFQLIVYLAFFGIIMNYYGLPFHIIRNFIRKFNSLRKRIGDLISYWQATSGMDVRFPEATLEEIEEAEVCSICFDGLETARTSKLPCGHILHYHCLRNLFLKKQECPLCRSSVFAPPRQTRQRNRSNNTTSGSDSNARDTPKEQTESSVKEQILQEQVQTMQTQMDSMRETMEELRTELNSLKQYAVMDSLDEITMREGGGGVKEKGKEATGENEGHLSEMRKRRLLHFSSPK